MKRVYKKNPYLNFAKMNTCFTSFCSEISHFELPKKLNNPFELETPKICKLAVQELQDFLIQNQQYWQHNFGLETGKKRTPKGKMFGVLVVRNKFQELGYLATFSGRLADEDHHEKFVPSLFDVSTDDYFINRGMSELSVIGNQIKQSNSAAEITFLKSERKRKSVDLQQQLFDCYHFLNHKGKTKSLCAIFENSVNKIPPSGAGECAAPKLLQY
jgi:tRNA pseudouridine32 synthase/23S rRNA pseudouridine746 synthase